MFYVYDRVNGCTYHELGAGTIVEIYDMMSNIFKAKYVGNCNLNAADNNQLLKR